MPPFAPCCRAAEIQPSEDAEGSWVNGDLLSEVLPEGATVLRVIVQPAVGKGENFFSILYRTHVDYRTVESDRTQIRHYIVKGAPIGEFIQAYVEETCSFRRETSIYGDALPRMYAFADAQLGEDSFKRFSAGFHKTSRPDTLILDDLKQTGFVMASRRDRLDFAHSKLVVQNLARFHALSTAYTEKHPDYILQFEDKMFNEESRARLTQIYTRIFKTFSETIKKWEAFGNITNKFDAMEEKYVNKLIDVCKLPEGCRKVLAHGDCWVNNMMFKYSGSDQPDDLRFVDFQLSRVASPAIDLNYFLFTSPRTDVRTQHFDELLQEYCDVFAHYAKKLGYSGSLITVEEIRREMDRTAFFAFNAAISTMIAMLTDPEDAVDVAAITEEEMETTDHPSSKVYASARFREAFENMLPYFDERGIFD